MTLATFDNRRTFARESYLTFEDGREVLVSSLPANAIAQLSGPVRPWPSFPDRPQEQA